MADRYDDAELLLVERLADCGVRSVRFVGGPGRVGVWLVTDSDVEAHALRARVGVGETVTEALRSAGFTTREAATSGVVVQSEETVARDYEGSWFYAMR
jgi:hypothetical protein